jgi:hypothetical protein
MLHFEMKHKYLTAELSLEGVLGDALAPPQFRDSENRTERQIDSLLLSAPPDLKT